MSPTPPGRSWSGPRLGWPNGPESEFPEITAWRRIQPDGPETHPIPVRVGGVAARFRKDGSLPSIHPLVDVCNAVSLAYAIPIAVADRRGHQVLISSTSVRTTLGASGCDKSKHQRAETKARQPRRE
jgi:hypothetical protein